MTFSTRQLSYVCRHCQYESRVEVMGIGYADSSSDIDLDPIGHLKVNQDLTQRSPASNHIERWQREERRQGRSPSHQETYAEARHYTAQRNAGGDASTKFGLVKCPSCNRRSWWGRVQIIAHWIGALAILLFGIALHAMFDQRLLDEWYHSVIFIGAFVGGAVALLLHLARQIKESRYCVEFLDEPPSS